MAIELLVIQHAPWEGPGKFLIKAAKSHGVRLHIIKAYLHPIPENIPYHGLILLGGSPNVDEDERYPFLKAEKEFIRKAIGTDKPCLGICLGHQLLAHVLGAEVGPNFCTSIGFIDGHLTHAGKEHPLFNDFPSHFPLYKWHGQAVAVPLPKHLQILATSTECQVEAFSVVDRPHIIGVQFDNHAAAPKDVARWLEKDEWVPMLKKKGIPVEEKLTPTAATSTLIEEQFHLFFRNFLEFM